MVDNTLRMSKNKFLRYLIGITLALVVFALLFHGRGEIGKFTDFSLYAITAFFMLSYLMFYLGTKAAKSQNKYTFNNIIVGNMILKMFMCVVIVLVYKNIYEIQSRAFLFPFLIIYLSYTIFETYFLTKLAKTVWSITFEAQCIAYIYVQYLVLVVEDLLVSALRKEGTRYG